MYVRWLVVALVCAAGLYAGASLVDSLRRPARTVVEPIEIESDPGSSRSGRRGSAPGEERDRNSGRDRSRSQPAPAEPAPAPAPAVGGGDDADDDGDDATGTDG